MTMQNMAMQRISIELAPRDEAALRNQIKMVRETYPEIDTINFPDLLKYELRSYECCSFSKDYFKSSIPHLRAIDFNPQEPFPLKDYFRDNRIEEVLVISGDPPQDMSKRVYPTGSVEFIGKLKREIPELKIYAAVDPYRHSPRKEMDLVRRKIDVGAAGFFTQPFFDLRLIEVYADLLGGGEVFWGLSPVTTEQSHYYWETKKQRCFPPWFCAYTWLEHRLRQTGS